LPLIDHSRPTLGNEEIRRVAEVLASGQIAQGEVVGAFEQAFSRVMGGATAVAVSSGTAALHLALSALGVGPGSEVVVPSYVCSALLNAVHYVGATPVVVDVEPRSGNIDPADVAAHLTAKSRAVIVPHIFGQPADLKAIQALGLPVIEDCAQALGATIGGQPVGTFGDVAIFSFYATKVIATGEGGMVVTRSGRLAEEVRDRRDYDNREDYRLRFNYKLTDIQAAIGLSQIGRLPDFLRRRQAIAGSYDRAFSSVLAVPVQDPQRIYFRYVIDTGGDAESWINQLMEAGIRAARPVYRPLHRYLKIAACPVSETLWRQTLSLPIYPALTEKEMRRVISAVLRIVKELK
jgi:dTDP-4-amino-4,6-dideoxygalactose transaminase